LQVRPRQRHAVAAAAHVYLPQEAHSDEDDGEPRRAALNNAAERVLEPNSTRLTDVISVSK